MFKKGASGGPDDLCPQHLADMMGQGLGKTGNRLLETLVYFINHLVIPEKVNVKITATYYAVNLTALEKLDDGARPIVSGHTLRRLAAKCVMSKLRSLCEKEFRPSQMGVGTPKGCEAAVHAVRAYVESNSFQDQVLLKIDFKNAFNSVHRDVVLTLLREKVPESMDSYNNVTKKTLICFLVTTHAILLKASNKVIHWARFCSV